MGKIMASNVFTKNEILKELRECDSGTEQGKLKLNALLKEKLELDKQVQTL